jgi:hypothetical protein
LTTTEVELTEGKHYWEVELLSESMSHVYIGISRPNLDPKGCRTDKECTDGWFVEASDGDLYGNGKPRRHSHRRRHAPGNSGDRVGVLLDLDNGSLRFFKNGAAHGPGYEAGSVTGPVVAAVHMINRSAYGWPSNYGVRLLPNAEVPAHSV